MKFNLDGLPEVHKNVATGDGRFGAASKALADGRGRIGGITEKYNQKKADALNAYEGSIEKFEDQLPQTYKALTDYKTKWSTWLKGGERINFWLLLTNFAYVATTIAILTLTFLTVEEHVNDFNRNEHTKHVNLTSGASKSYPPCGMPTPDSMYLLQALGAVPSAGWDGASLEPDYQNWMIKVNRALCTRTVPGIDPPRYEEDFAKCNEPGATYGIEFAEEMLAIGHLLDDSTITTSRADIEGGSAFVEKKRLRFETLTCLKEKDNGDEPYYPKHHREAYGDIKTRVGRAYLAAMPAFSRYHNRRSVCAVPSEFTDPFTKGCEHSCHIRKALKDAHDDQHIMHSAFDSTTDVSSFSKQVYRLLALSLASYYDRYHNNGECFKNLNKLPAYEFCQNSMTEESGSSNLLVGSEIVKTFATRDAAFAASSVCGDPRPPSPPPPPVTRQNSKEIREVASHVCATTLQYGLFEQARLFGLPDVLGSFVVDNRADRNLHFIAKWIYDAMYTKPSEKASELLQDPKARLELYIAYRLSSSSLWAILVANVAGYMMVRAALPMLILILKLVFKLKSNIVETPEKGGNPAVMQDVTLVRPQIGWPVKLAMGINVLTIYWIMWLDPATQSHYYVTTSCEDYKGLGVHVPSSAFQTTWGKRRFGRFGEHVIGVLLIVVLLLVVLQEAVGKAFVPELVLQDAKLLKPGGTARLWRPAIFMIVFALVIQILFITQSIISGDGWFESVRATDETHEQLDTFSRDVIMSVWAAFWTSASISWYRQKWAIDQLPTYYQYAWMGCCALTLWMPVLQMMQLLSEQIDVAFTDGKGTADMSRQIIIICILAVSGLWSVLLAIQLKRVLRALPDRYKDYQDLSEKQEDARAARINDAIDAKQKRMEARAAARDAEYRFNNIEPIFQAFRNPKLDFSSARFAPTRSTFSNVDLEALQTDSVHMPLMPK